MKLLSAFTGAQLAFRLSQARACPASNLFFHVQVRLPKGENLTRQQWEKTANRIERMLGLKDQPRAIAFHIDKKTGEEHMHVAWSRIDAETMQAIALPFYKERLKKICRELEREFGITQVKNERDSKIDYAPTRDEHEQARRLGVDVHKIRETIRACYDRSDCGQSFKAALEHEAVTLAQGDRRDYLAVYEGGGYLNLGKKLLGATAAQVRNKLVDIDREKLPTLDQAREQILSRDLAHVQNQIAVLPPQAEPARYAAEQFPELERLIFGALLDKTIQQGRTDEIQLLVWRMPDEFIDVLNNCVDLAQEARQQKLGLGVIGTLITERGQHAFQLDGAEHDRLVMLHQKTPVLAFVAFNDRLRHHEQEIERLDPLIYGGLLDCATRSPELRDKVNLLAWRMPHEFLIGLNENIAAVADAQARNLDLPALAKLIDEYNKLAHLSAAAEIDKLIEKHRAPQPWDRDADNREWEAAVINAAIEKANSDGTREKTIEEAQPAELAEKVLAGAGAVAELAIQGMELVADFLTGGTPPPSPHQIHSEILADIDKLKRRGERDIPPQQDLVGKVLEAAEPIAELGMRGFEMVLDFFGGGTALKPERMQAAIDERKQLRREAAAEQHRAEVDLERYRRDPEYRRHVHDTKPWRTDDEKQRDAQHEEYGRQI